MANNLTHKGQEEALDRIVSIAAAIRLFTDATQPSKDGTGFTEVADGNGYSSGGKSINSSNWTAALVSGNRRITLDDFTWTANNGTIDNIKGAYIVDGNDNPLAWWERSTAITLQAGESITADDLFIELT